MKCKTQKCRKKKSDKSSYCRQCRYQLEKDKDLVAWSYRCLKANSKRRGKDFTLTLDEFRQFCYETHLMVNRGKKSTSFSVDRIDNSKGYSIDNIQVLTLSQNTQKRNKTLRFDYLHPDETKVVEKISYEDKDCPF